MMLPIWSTNNVINSGHRSSSSGRRVNPPSCDVTAHRDRLQPAGRFETRAFWNIPQAAAHDPRSEDIWEKRKMKCEGLSIVI